MYKKQLPELDTYESMVTSKSGVANFTSILTQMVQVLVMLAQKIAKKVTGCN